LGDGFEVVEQLAGENEGVGGMSVCYIHRKVVAGECSRRVLREHADVLEARVATLEAELAEREATIAELEAACEELRAQWMRRLRRRQRRNPTTIGCVSGRRTLGINHSTGFFRRKRLYPATRHLQGSHSFLSWA
jgi:hypothetical protein